MTPSPVAAWAGLLLVVATYGCVPSGRAESHAYELGTIGGFAELVNSGVKTLALSEVLPPDRMDAILPEAEQVAARNHVRLYRERNLLVTDLFPADVAKGKDVLLIYQGGTLDEYLALKADAEALERAGQYTGRAREAIARRFGRMLSYPTWRINQLLAQNSSFRTMRDFGLLPATCSGTTVISTAPPHSIGTPLASSW